MSEPILPPQPPPVDSRFVALLPVVWVILCVSLLLGIGGLQSQTRILDQKRMSVQPAGYFVDINHDDIGELMLLPGVGKSIAKRIIKDRKENGPYESLEHLNRVSGISRKTLDRIRLFLLPIKTTAKN